MARINRFSRTRLGTPLYTCRVCGKRTRETGEGESSCELCKRCFIISSVENIHSDNSHTGPFAQCEECMRNLQTYSVTL